MKTLTYEVIGYNAAHQEELIGVELDSMLASDMQERAMETGAWVYVVIRAKA